MAGVRPLLLSEGNYLQVKFSDGSSVHQDPRREDPLVYYLPAGDWSRAVGVEILPLYEEHEAESVVVRVWPDHLARLRSMGDAELGLIVRRLAHALTLTFRRWKDLATEWPDWLVERIGESALTQPFADAGWRLQSRDNTSTHLWRR